MLEKLPSNFKLSLLGKELLPVPTAKDLAVVIDSTLSLSEHVTHTVSKCIARQINRMKYALDRKILTTNINALVLTFSLVKCRTKRFQDSFIPYAVKSWDASP